MRVGSSSRGSRVVVKGGGDLGTGVAWRLPRCGFRVLVTETAQRTVVRRTVAFASAVYEGVFTVDGVTARLVEDDARMLPTPMPTADSRADVREPSPFRRRHSDGARSVHRRCLHPSDVCHPRLPPVGRLARYRCWWTQRDQLLSDCGPLPW